MKKIILTLIILLNISCVNYYNVVLTSDTVLYEKEGDVNSIVCKIPSGSIVYIKGKKIRNYRKVKYGKCTGWANNPSYEQSKNTSSSNKSNNYRKSSSENSNFGNGTVKVKGYYRKNGTYVKPHTRSAPRSKK